MEVIFSAILGELASRSISFLLDKYLRKTKAPPPPPSEEELNSILQRLLLRIRVVAEEADGRRITNQAMLHQLGVLKDKMYRGCYVLDGFSCRAHGEEDMIEDHQAAGRSFAPSKFNPAKRVRFHRGRSRAEALEEVLASLEITIDDLCELAVLVSSCPRLHRQPYSMHLVLDKCMFNRQMEMEHAMNFLLREETSHGDEGPGVLPIIGPGKVGKSTLIEHVCDDERVRSHFSQIVCFNGDDLEDASAVTIRDRGVIKHRNRAMDGRRTLIIIELVHDIDDRVWRRLFSAARSCIGTGSKIIITSRSDKIARFGTTQALRVQFFTREAYWYFFKVRIFGSTDMEDHPELAAIAMDMARELNGCFMAAAILHDLLKANFNTHFFSMVLGSIRYLNRKNASVYGTHFSDPWQMEKPVYVRRAKKTSSDEYFVILDNYQTCHVHSSGQSEPEPEPELPKMTGKDLFFGSVRPQGKFKVLAWKSHLPPHYNYIFKCEIQRRKVRSS